MTNKKLMLFMLLTMDYHNKRIRANIDADLSKVEIIEKTEDENNFINRVVIKYKQEFLLFTIDQVKMPDGTTSMAIVVEKYYSADLPDAMQDYIHNDLQVI